MGQGEERGVWQELVPKIHWALLGCGLEPASGAAPAPRPTRWLAQLRSARLGYSWALPHAGRGQPHAPVGRAGGPAQPSPAPAARLQPSWPGGWSLLSIKCKAAPLSAASPGGSTGSTPGAPWGMQEVSGQGLAVPVTGAGRRLQRGCVWLSQAGLECQGELEPHQHSCPSSWSRACVSAAGLPLP